MKDDYSFPLYQWMVNQFKDTLSPWANKRDLAEKARKAFLNQAAVLLLKTRQRKPPFNPFAILQLRKIHTVTWVNADKGREEARLIPDEDGFRIVLRRPENAQFTSNEELQRHIRVRTTLAHEIGHTYFYDLSERPPSRGPERYQMLSSRSRIVREKEEWWCFDFARELLLPGFSVRRFCQGLDVDPSLNTALKLRKTFNVSWDLLLRRLVYDLRIWKTCAIFRLRFDGSQLILNNKKRDVWIGANFRIKNLNTWISNNSRFLLNRFYPIFNSNDVTRLSQFRHPIEKNLLVEFLPIRRDSKIVLCLIKEKEQPLDVYA